MPKRTHRNPDHVERHNTPSQNNQAIADQLKALLTPAIWGQQGYYRQLGMRDRLLNLSRSDGSSVDSAVATGSWSAGIDSLASKRRLTLVSSYKSQPTSTFRTILGSGKYVVIIDLNRQGRIIVMNKVPDSANMIFQLFRKG